MVNQNEYGRSSSLSESGPIEQYGITRERSAQLAEYLSDGETEQGRPTPEDVATDEAIDAAFRRLERVARGDNKEPGQLAVKNKHAVELSLAADRLERRSRWVAPALFRGNKTATEYDSRVTNYSTRTEIISLSDERKIFLVYNYPTSWIHRGMDGLMKFLTGCKMAKSSSRHWKDTFESRSLIPTIPIGHQDVVALPFIPNINAYDLFANRSKIADFGECDFAKDITTEQLFEILRKVTVKISGAHDDGTTWGELILPNIIVDKEANPHICDPETQYYADVPILEQKARDLLDFITSSAAALNQHDNVDYEQTISQIVGAYPNQEVLVELKRLAQEKPKLLHRLFFGYTKVRLNLKNQKELKQIKEAVVAVLSR